jgi:outer membrane protein TolC
MRRDNSILFPLKGLLSIVMVGFFSGAGTIASGQTVEDIQQLAPASDPLYLPDRPEQVRPEPPRQLTLQQTLELARTYNRELQIARDSLKKATFALERERAALLPGIGTRVEFFNGRDAKDSIDNLENGDPPRNEIPLDARLEITYDLYTSGRREALIKAAEEQLRAERLEVEQIEKQVNLEVTLAYYDLQESGETVRIVRVAVNNAEITLRDAELLEAGEIGTRFDVIRARVQLANAQQELTSALADLDIAHRRLLQLLSLAETAEIIAVDPVQPRGEWTIALENSVLLAYRNRGELQQQLARSNVSEQQRRAALAETSPQVSLFAGYQLRNDFETSFGFVDGYAVGTRLRWDFFDGGAARATAEEAATERAIAQTRFADTRNKIRLQVEKAYRKLQTSQKNIQTATFATEQARENLPLARLRFQAGVGTQLDVIAAENDLTLADSRRVRAILDYNRALAELERAVGFSKP